jgi:heme o synthase
MKKENSSAVKVSDNNSALVSGVRQKLQDYGILMKFKLSLTVVFSAVMAFLIALDTPVVWTDLLILTLGGCFVTGAASALNQVLERDYDALMKRTENRPLAAGRMTSSEAVLVAGLASLVGISLLALFNPMTAFLGMVSLILYAFVYTPMKRVSNIAVLIGAVPGALPMVIGAVAAQDGRITMLAFSLFAIQFLWQMPHFWAIGWLADEDYKKAGFRLLPTKDGVKDANTGLQATIYALFLLPVSWLSFGFGYTHWIAAVLLSLAALAYAFMGWRLHKACTRETARALMFSSFFYLPFVLLVLYFGKM